MQQLQNLEYLESTHLGKRVSIEMDGARRRISKAKLSLNPSLSELVIVVDDNIVEQENQEE